MIDKLIRFCLENKLILALLTIFAVTWGITVAPFAWDIPLLPKNPIAVDAIPDIGENQQIVFTAWPGRSPKDVEDQVTYPLTIALLGVPQIKTVRSFSHLGFSSIYIIFKDDVDYYWSRSRVVERLASLPKNSLPDGISPQLGPDATALGQVFWYTLEGRNEQGEPAGGWSPEELRSIQDWQVRYALQGVDGVAEVSSIGGFVKEYQIDLLPDAMRAYKVSLGEVVMAVKSSNRDVGARTLEINNIEYIIRGLGLIQSLDDIGNTVVKVDTMAGTPIRIKDIADVNIGPALRRGALDKNGLEAVGGVVVARYGDNPLAVIDGIKKKIAELAPSLPLRTLENGEQSKLTIVPFYDRSRLIHETLHTLYTALHDEILATILVVVGMMLSPVGSILISGVLPLAVLGCFILMKVFSVDANIVALSGIAIAIGTMVDMGIVLTENIQKHLDAAPEGSNKLSVVHEASVEVGSAIIAAVSTTIISFIPIFTMEAAEGKLFKPLAWTKTFS
ncbi:MAG: efflux RND transporter permease subunit, partial [bacterium]|nr:efflux RND transporter permease subunit [bacterium]